MPNNCKGNHLQMIYPFTVSTIENVDFSVLFKKYEEKKQYVGFSSEKCKKAIDDAFVIPVVIE